MLLINFVYVNEWNTKHSNHLDVLLVMFKCENMIFGGLWIVIKEEANIGTKCKEK